MYCRLYTCNRLGLVAGAADKQCKQNKYHQSSSSTLDFSSTMDTHRTAESPMDFEWQTRAPADVSSPFYQLSVHHDNQKKRESAPFLPALSDRQALIMSSTRPKRSQLPLSASPIRSPSSFPSRGRRMLHQPPNRSSANPPS